MVGASHDPRFFTGCWFLVGSTAVGKTRVGLALAERIGAEIIALDSMTVYRGMDIGTAKPSVEDRRRVLHHLIDIVDPTDEYSVSEYLAAAHEAVEGIRQRGKIPLFVGGTPLYLSALVRGLDPGPPPDPAYRQELEMAAERDGLAALYRRLEWLDPLAASHIHPHDKKRIIRALEVHRATGEPISHRQRHFEESPEGGLAHGILLEVPRPVLHRRIERRIEAMFEAGLVEEAKGLVERYGELGRTARQAVGYREALDVLAGAMSVGQAVERVKVRTRRFARHQETWWRRFGELRRVDASSEAPEELAERIVREAGDAAS